MILLATILSGSALLLFQILHEEVRKLRRDADAGYRESFQRTEQIFPKYTR